MSFQLWPVSTLSCPSKDKRRLTISTGCLSPTLLSAPFGTAPTCRRFNATRAKYYFVQDYEPLVIRPARCTPWLKRPTGLASLVWSTPRGLRRSTPATTTPPLRSCRPSKSPRPTRRSPRYGREPGWRWCSTVVPKQTGTVRAPGRSEPRVKDEFRRAGAHRFCGRGLQPCGSTARRHLGECRAPTLT